MFELYSYVKKRPVSVFLIYLYTICIYGVWISQCLVTLDSEGLYFTGDAQRWYTWWYVLGRWAMVLVKTFFGVRIINPFFQMAVFGLLFPISAILWCFCFYKWNVERESVFSELIFSGILLSHPIWALQFSYMNQLETIIIAMVILPVSMIFLTDRKAEFRLVRIIVSAGMIIFCFGTYQSFMFVYAEAIVIYLLFRVYRDYREGNRKDFFKETGFLGIFTIGCYVINMLITRFMCSRHGLVYGSDYLDSQFRWGKDPALTNIKFIFSYFGKSLIGDGIVYSSLGMIEMIIGLIMIALIFRKRIKAGLMAIALFAVSWIIPHALVIVTAYDVVDRSQFCIAFTLAFYGAAEFGIVIDYLHNRKKYNLMGAAFALMVLCCLLPQVQKNTRLLYSHYMTMYTDEIKLREIYHSALEKGACEGYPIVFIGSKENYKTEAIIDREAVGFSYFEVNAIAESKIVETMRAYGMDVRVPTQDEYSYAYGLAENLGIWPDPDGIVVDNGIIIVRLS